MKEHKMKDMMDDIEVPNVFKILVSSSRPASTPPAATKEILVPQQALRQRSAREVPTATEEHSIGNDQLGIEHDGRALAQTIALQDLKPPFTLGLLGGWGTGKTFMFHIIEKELINIQKMKKNAGLYCNNLYLVKFDAWTFSKGDIWSSLMFRILTDLNKQIQLEKLLKKFHKDNDQEYEGISLLEELNALSDSQMKYLKERIGDSDLRKNIEKMFENKVSGALSEAVNINGEEKAKELKATKRNIVDIEKELRNLEKLEKDKLEEDKRAEELQKEIVITEDLERISSAAIHEAILTTLKEAFMGEKERLFGPSENALNMELKKALSSTGLIFELLSHGGYLAVSILLFVAISTILPVVFAFLHGRVEYLWALAAPLLAVSSRYLIKYNELVEIYKDHLGTLHDVESKQRDMKETDVEAQNGDRSIIPSIKEEIKDIQSNLQIKHDELQVATEKAKSIKDQLWLNEGEDLLKILDESSISGYEQNLGIVHKAQQDLRKLSSAMLAKEDSSARIIIFIDDLDRCPVTAIVRTLEALQLLVKTTVFVVVVAIDLDYVTLSLEKHYKGVLRKGSHPSGLDYLEKIIQLPYRMSPVKERDTISKYINSLTEPRESTHKNHKDQNKIEKSGGDIKVKDTIDANETKIPAEDMVTDTCTTNDKSTRGDKISDNEEESNEEKADIDACEQKVPQISLTNEEKDMIKDTCVKVQLSPRVMKRLINVFQTMKIILYRKHNSSDKYVELPLMKASFKLLALSACDDYRIRYEMSKVHAYLEANQHYDENVSNLLQLISKVANLNNTCLVKYHDLFQSLETITWADEKKWEMVKSFLRLVRSFSFLGEFSEERKETYTPMREAPKVVDNESLEKEHVTKKHRSHGRFFKKDVK